MELVNDAVSINKLNELLLDAMNQSRALFDKLEEQTQFIEHLKRENEQLQHELGRLRASQAESRHHNDVSAQLEHLFQQDAEKQAEIERLRTELRAAQPDGSRQLSEGSQLSSPVALTHGVKCISASYPSRAPALATDDLPSSGSKRRREDTPVPISSPGQKRPRAGTQTEVLKELSPNAVKSVQRWYDRKGWGRLTRGAEAIALVTEDGEHHNRKENEDPTTGIVVKNQQSGLHRRLDILLSVASPTNSALVRPDRQPAKSVSPQTCVEKKPSLTKSSSDIGSTSKDGRPSSLRFLRPGRHWEHAPEDDAPLRGRALQTLNLSHFKLNSVYHGRHEPASEEHVRTKEQKRCLPGCVGLECCGTHMRALLLTLGPDWKLSDDDLLIDFLGPGSERKIATLTSVARENLLHEARVKRVANEYGKMHRNGRARAMTPSGFWNTGMPGLQEAKQHREEARRWEREEVERRYREAWRNEGKWTFADE